MRRRRGERREHCWAIVPTHLRHPRPRTTPATLTAELDSWSATLRPREHPPAILDRLRLASADGTVPLDWHAREAETRIAATELLNKLKASEAAHPPVMWAP